MNGSSATTSSVVTEGGRGPALRSASIALVVIVVDLATKALVAAVGPVGPLDPVRNHEFSLGLASAPWPVMLAVMAAMILLAWRVTWPAVRDGRCTALVPGLLCGGAAANLANRAVSGSVHDFFSLGPVVINVADVAVLVGIVLFYVNLRQFLPARPDDADR